MSEGPLLRRLIVTNLSLQSATEAVSLLSGLLVTLVLSRHLGVAGFGQFNYLFAFLYFFLTANDLGVNTIVVREISREPDRAGHIIGSLLSFRLALAAASLLVLWGVVLAVDYSPELRAALALFGLVLPLNAFRLPVAIFQSRLRFDYAAVVDMSNRVVTTALVLTVAGLGAGLFGVTIALVGGEAVGVFVALSFSRRLVRPVWRVEPAYWWVVLRWSLPLGMSTVFSAVVNRADFLMLERMADLSQLGLYGAAYKLTSLAERLPQMIVATLYPLMARRAAEDPRALRALYRKSLLALTGVAFLVVAATALLAVPLVHLVFGDEYLDAVRALRILVLATGCLCLALPGGFLLISLGQVRLNFLAMAAGAVTNISLNLILIPRFGYLGAAAATVAAYGVVLATTIVAVEWAIGRAVLDAPRRGAGDAVVAPSVPGAAMLE
jgi:O-antigen/teichoic acid export membrane protein